MTGTLASALAQIEWLRPAWLLALLPLPPLLWRLGVAARANDPWATVIDAPLRPLVTRAAAGHRGGVALLGAALVATVVALAGPTLPGPRALADRGDAMRVLVVDLSPAMAGDGATGPIERVRLELLELMRALPPAQTALIVYAEEPYLVVPPTTDVATVSLLVPELGPDVMPVPGNRPDRALRMAAELLDRSGVKQRDVIWITTRSLHPEGWSAVGGLAAAQVRLSVLVVDTAAGAPESSSAPNPLREYAATGGGTFQPLRSDDADLRALAASFATDPPDAAARPPGGERDVGIWLLPLLLPLAALAFRRGVLLALALPLLTVPHAADAAAFADLWLRPDQQAVRLLRNNEPGRAAELFTDPRWRAAALYRAGRFADAETLLTPFGDADSLYNRGNALVRLQRLDEALEAFDAALALRPDDPDARHNRDLVHRLLDRRDDENRHGNADDNAPGREDRDPGASDPRNGGKADDATRRASAGSGSAPPPASPNARHEAPRPTNDRPSGATSANGVPGAALTASMPGARNEGARTPHAAPRHQDDSQREAELLTEQWLRRVPDEPAGLLRRKLLLEHQRRESGEASRPWR